MKYLQVMLGSVECTIPQPIYQNWSLSSVFASDKEKAFFKKEFASAQEEMERHKKALRDVKKVGISKLFVPKLALLMKSLVRPRNGDRKHSNKIRLSYLLAR
jgi:hypothetical protein